MIQEVRGLRGGLPAVLALLCAALPAPGAARKKLEYAPAPVNNPLKGLVPYMGEGRDRFPHSMEFTYLPLSAIVTGPDSYDWTALEKVLQEISSRGKQAIFRVYLEYPGQETGIPPYLIKGGLKITIIDGADGSGKVPVPDYEDPHLRAALRAFIRELGARYDGDPRIGYLTAGLLGAWGEWHTYPRPELFASKTVQAEVMDAYQAAFKTTPILLRYPAGTGDSHYAANDTRPLGYHDDSFAWATLATGRPDDSWFFQSLLQTAGAAAVKKWQTQPIGGEIRPEAWGTVFDAQPKRREIQNFDKCVATTHATWLMDSGMFRNGQPAERRARAQASVRKMGYELHVPAYAVEWDGDSLSVKMELVNRGVAPFYHPWRFHYGLLDRRSGTLHQLEGTGTATGLLKGAPARRWTERLVLPKLPNGGYVLLTRLANPLAKGVPLRFANMEQDRDRAGWLTLGRLRR